MTEADAAAEIRRRDFLADLAALGYGDAQAADVIGCTPSTVFRIRQGGSPASPVIANALRYHRRLVDAGLEPPAPAPLRGRPPRSSAAALPSS